MTSNDKWALPLAKKLLNKSGKSITYRKVTKGEYDPITDTETSSTTDYSIKALITAPELNMIDNSLIKSTSLILMIAGQSITFNIDVSDVVLIDGVEYGVSILNPNYSGELIAYYNLVANIK